MKSFATGAYRAVDVQREDGRLLHTVTGPGGKVCLDDCSSFHAAVRAAIELNWNLPLNAVRRAAA